MSECWPWYGAKDSKGYGRKNVNGHNRKAHRFVYTQLVGPIPDGKYLDHICRNRSCVNPNHLRPVTPKQNATENSVSPSAIHAAKSTCPKGHEYTVYTRKNGKNMRVCAECRRASDAKRYSDFLKAGGTGGEWAKRYAK